MRNLRIFNSLSHKIEEFRPIRKGAVGMYTCGPTVYNFMHIGNLRTFLMADILTRVLLIDGYEVKTVRNITDIDDKIIKNAREKGVSLEEFSAEYTKAFFSDLDKLNILPVSQSPFATEHISGMIKLTQKLLDKGFAYLEKDGSVYFDISKFPRYGRLSGIEKKELKTGTRILSDEYTKDNIQDFALWKSVQTDEFGYDSPWGRGRPGWHIECSVMSGVYLGETFDIHTGGIDLMFPHHENEIAQSEAATGKEFVHYFVHGEHILVNGQKMSKSLHNFYTLHDLEQRGFDPLAYRYLILTAHYRDKLNFTLDSLEASANTLKNLRTMIADFDQPTKVDESMLNRFIDTLNNDLGTPQSLAIMWEMLRSEDLPSSRKSATLLEMDKVLGIRIGDYLGKKIEIPSPVQELVEKREKARQNKDFTLSDNLRAEIQKLGFEVMDTPNGPKIIRA